ncbi:zinc ribbon domain-containing protein [Sporomusa aerivorans]|uniref:zinc ribbon domain-containing protein n=1 Tax=Sporomusa aerivorans TaxID=204936 RepID=UPI00352A03DC
MKCPNCGEQIEAGAGKCLHCGHEMEVTVLSRQDRDSFNGITIEEENRDSRRQYGGGGADEKIRVKQINLAFDSSSWLSKLAIAAVLALLVFFFLPMLMFFLLVGGVILIAYWLLRTLVK